MLGPMAPRTEPDDGKWGAVIFVMALYPSNLTALLARFWLLNPPVPNGIA